MRTQQCEEVCEAVTAARPIEHEPVRTLYQAKVRRVLLLLHPIASFWIFLKVEGMLHGKPDRLINAHAVVSLAVILFSKLNKIPSR